MAKSAPAPPDAAIEARGLTKVFGDRYALRGVDLSVGRGEHLVIFGPNGAGKTTLVKILATLVKPSSGDVWLDGSNLRARPELVRRKLSLVSHQTFLYDNLTVYENLRFYGRMYGIPDLERNIREVAARVQLETRLHQRAGTLSHGLQRRAAIARAVLHDPPILFLDEPEAGLDPRATSVVREILGSVNTGERTVIITTHNLERGLELGDRVVILHRGQVVFQAPRREVDAAGFRRVYDRCTGAGR